MARHPSPPLVAIFNSRDEVIDAIRSALEREGFLTVTARLAEIQNGTLEPRPKARLVITSIDLQAVGEKRSKVVQFDLPEGVVVSPEDRKRTIEYRVVERAATPAP